jgi:hypothetical protein
VCSRLREGSTEDVQPEHDQVQGYENGSKIGDNRAVNSISLIVQKEIIVIETIEAQRRGFLFLEGAQRIIDPLHNDPDIVEMSRIPVDDPIKSRGEPSGLEPIQLEEITGSENHEVPPPQIRSPRGFNLA